jgi:osmoprotectant transport system ATP-binding protein
MKCRVKIQKLADVARPVKTFQPLDSVAFALSELKNSGEYLAIVMNSKHPIGILVSDEVLLKLI